MIFEVETAEDVRDVLNGTGTFEIRGMNTKHAFRTPAFAETASGGQPASSHILKTGKMNGIVEWSPDDLVVVVKAGTTVADLNEALATRNQMLGVPGYTTGIGRLTAGLPGTVGGLVSANLPTRWESRCRNARYWVLGLTFVMADRTVIRCGSKAVKNVAGYDVQKLLVGAWGTLGVITEVILRTQPLKQFDNEPRTNWNGEPPFCIVRTLPSEMDEYIATNPLKDTVVDRDTGTIWARVTEQVPKPAEGWVMNVGFGDETLAPPADNLDLMRAIKSKLDPVGRWNPGRLL